MADQARTVRVTPSRPSSHVPILLTFTIPPHPTPPYTITSDTTLRSCADVSVKTILLFSIGRSYMQPSVCAANCKYECKFSRIPHQQYKVPPPDCKRAPTGNYSTPVSRWLCSSLCMVCPLTLSWPRLAFSFTRGPCHLISAAALLSLPSSLFCSTKAPTDNSTHTEGERETWPVKHARRDGGWLTQRTACNRRRLC